MRPDHDDHAVRPSRLRSSTASRTARRASLRSPPRPRRPPASRPRAHGLGRHLEPDPDQPGLLEPSSPRPFEPRAAGRGDRDPDAARRRPGWRTHGLPPPEPCVGTIASATRPSVNLAELYRGGVSRRHNHIAGSGSFCACRTKATCYSCGRACSLPQSCHRRAVTSTAARSRTSGVELEGFDSAILRPQRRVNGWIAVDVAIGVGIFYATGGALIGGGEGSLASPLTLLAVLADVAPVYCSTIRSSAPGRAPAAPRRCRVADHERRIPSHETCDSGLGYRNGYGRWLR